jgi:lysophospholipase L1-like esterase
MTLLVIGNSVSLPPAPNVAAYPELVAARLAGTWHVRTVIHSGATIEQMEGDVQQALDERPDCVVLQVGINECAPRPLSVAERERLGRLRPLTLRHYIIRAIHHLRPHIIRMRALHQFTPLPRFVEAVARTLAYAAERGARVLVLPLTPVTATAERRTPYSTREIVRYNAALAGFAGPRVDVVSAAAIFGDRTADELCMSPDTVHLSASAHEAIATYVVRWLQQPAGGDQ